MLRNLTGWLVMFLAALALGSLALPGVLSLTAAFAAGAFVAALLRLFYPWRNDS